MKNIASVDLELAKLDNRVRKKVTLSVEQPWKVSDQEWSTRVTDPETKRKQVVSGNDGIQVLARACPRSGLFEKSAF